MSPWRRIRGGISILIVVIAVGTTGYILIEGVTVFDALYMVVITITTVGFEEAFELSAAGQLWTLGLIGVGVGVALYTAAALIEYLIDLREVRKRIRMKKLVARKSDHVIVCGFGRVGEGTWTALTQNGNQVVVIETDPIRAEAAQEAGAAVVVGDATHNHTLEDAGIFKARAIIACVADDSDNLVIALSVKALRSDLRVVCRATEVESERKLRLAGADAVVAPQAVGAERLALMASQPEIAQIFDVVLQGSPIEFHIEELDVDSACLVAGKTIEESGIRQQSGALILAVEAEEKEMLVTVSSSSVLGIKSPRQRPFSSPQAEFSTGKR